MVADPGADPSAEATCAPAVYAWAARCAVAQRFALTAAACPGDELVVVAASVDAATVLRVELARTPQPGFRTVGDWQLSPVGDYPSWNRVPAPLREALDRVTACVRADGTLPSHARSEGQPRVSAPRHAQPAGEAPVHPHDEGPWLLLAAGVAALVAQGWRGWRGWRRRPVRVAVGAAVWAATLGVRYAVFAPAFFHQNGQGPAWIDQIIPGRYRAYGPGFAELFGWAGRLVPDHPERGVFAWQGALAALAPACAWTAARAAGGSAASAPIAGALALGVALDPVLGRTARSESYYAACASLLFLAVAALSGRAARAPVRSVAFGLTCAAAGMLVAQAVRIHPTCWAAAGLTPLVLLAGPGSLRRRLVRATAATGLTGAVATLAAGRAVLDVVRGEVGAHWLHRTGTGTSLGVWGFAGPVLAVSAAVVLASRRPRRAIPRVALLVTVLSVMAGADLVTATGSPVWITAAYARLYAPVLVACVAAVLAGMARNRAQSRALAAALVVLLAMVSMAGWRGVTRLPTDAIELRYALAWRDRLPRGARVASVERAGYYLLALPIYGGLGTRDLGTIPLDTTAPPPDLRAYGGVYYYRSSVCSTPAARAFCDGIERRNTLDPVVTYELPAVPSMAHLQYDTAPVRVGLYRVRIDPR